MRFQILGSVRVEVDGRDVPVTAGRDRVLLGVLLLHANQSVTRDQLIDAIWPGKPPRDVRNQLQGCVSRLRRRFVGVGLGRVIVTEPDGYRAVVDPGDLDLLEFRQLVGQARDAARKGRLEQAVVTYRAATALWRGPALAGVDGHAIPRAAATLDEERAQALEECLDAELAAGAGGELVAELTELVDRHPLREGLHRALMLGLYRAGRQADALAAYRQARRLLMDELGTEPGVELQELHQAVLNRDTALDTSPVTRPHPVSPRPRQLPSDVTGFSGRTEALKALDELLARRSEATGPVVISAIAGTAGVGKTALAVHWAHRVADRFNDGQMYINLRGFDAGGAPVDPATAIRGFLDALAVPPERVPAGLDAQTSLYRSLLADKQVLVVLDNASDPDQIRPLLPGAPGCLVLVTSRNQLAGLVATDGAIPLPIDLLPDEEARQLLAARLGGDRIAAEPQAVADLLTACAGLPLALAIVAARAAARPAFSLAAIAEQVRHTETGLAPWTGPDPASDLRAVFSWSYRALDPAAARLFRLLGLHPGPDLAAPAAASLASVPLPQAHRLLAHLTEANLIIEHLPGRYILHDLLRTYATEMVETHDSEPDRHTAQRRLLDHYVHAVYTARLMLDPHLRLPHEVVAPQPGVEQVEFFTREQAISWLSIEQPVLLGAIHQAPTRGFDVHAWQLAICLAFHLNWKGQRHHWLATQEIALRAAQRLDDRSVEAQAHLGIGSAYTSLGNYELAGEHLQRALDISIELGDRHRQAMTYLNLGWLEVRRGNREEALRTTQVSYDLFRQVDDRAGQAHALNSIAWCYSLLTDHRQAVLHCERAIAIQQEAGDTSEEGMTWHSLGYAYHHLGENRRAIECFRRSLALVDDGAYGRGKALVLHHLGDAHHALGQLPVARSAWQTALNLLLELDHPDADEVRAKLDRLDCGS
jgi:DNA-binding SARP family transcriptional activator/tetratricopeptide (TPR) repeat protein